MSRHNLWQAMGWDGRRAIFFELNLPAGISATVCRNGRTKRWGFYVGDDWVNGNPKFPYATSTAAKAAATRALKVQIAMAMRLLK